MSKLIHGLNSIQIFYFKSTPEFGKIIIKSHLCTLFKTRTDNNDFCMVFILLSSTKVEVFFMQQRTCTLRNILMHMLHRWHGHPISANLTESEIAQTKICKWTSSHFHNFNLKTIFTFLQNCIEFPIIKYAYELNIQPQSKHKKQFNKLHTK
jgi:hypothetical protein